jgi:SAM-dependent methyltransferase
MADFRKFLDKWKSAKPPKDIHPAVPRYQGPDSKLIGPVLELLPKLHGGALIHLARAALDELAASVPHMASGIARDLLLKPLEVDERFLVPKLVERTSPVMTNWRYQNEILQWNIEPGEKVLDVGSGGHPFSKATHLLDRHLGATTHRTEELVRDARPLMAADIYALPFRDKSWDFVFCSHVLEHLERPGDAIRELVRVGGRGYIETPTRTSDLLFNITRLPDHHRWHTLRQADTLVFVQWPKDEQRDVQMLELFKLFHARFENFFHDFVVRNYDLLFAQIHWNQTVKFVVVDANARIVDAGP